MKWIHRVRARALTEDLPLFMGATVLTGGAGDVQETGPSMAEQTSQEAAVSPITPRSTTVTTSGRLAVDRSTQLLCHSGSSHLAKAGPALPFAP